MWAVFSKLQSSTLKHFINLQVGNSLVLWTLKLVKRKLISYSVLHYVSLTESVQWWAMGWMAQFQYPAVQDFLFSIASTLTLGPTQPPIRWVLGTAWPGNEADHHLHLGPRSRKVELYLHPLICLHGLALTTLPVPFLLHELHNGVVGDGTVSRTLLFQMIALYFPEVWSLHRGTACVPCHLLQVHGIAAV